MADAPLTLFGTAFIGAPGDVKTVSDPTAIKELLECVRSNGCSHLDTARRYGDGSSEKMLGETDVVGLGFTVDTKILSSPGAHKPEAIHKSVQESLDALKMKKVHIMYLHGPDRTVPLEDVLRAVNDEYKAGAFEKFGISNYRADEVAQMVKICRDKGYVLPTVYQGNYNAVTRKNEDELFPLLRKEGISFYAYSPLAGSFLNGKAQTTGSTEGNRFDTSTKMGKMYKDLYFKDSYFKALDQLNEAVNKSGLSMVEIAIRWIYFHSQLKKELGDGVIIGSSKKEQFVSNMEYVKHGKLPEDLVDLLEQIWKDIKADAPEYHM